MNDLDDEFILPEEILDEWEFETEDADLLGEEDIPVLASLEDELYSDTD